MKLKLVWLAILGNFALLCSYASAWWVKGLARKLMEEIEKKEPEMGRHEGWKGSLAKARKRVLDKHD